MARGKSTWRRRAVVALAALALSSTVFAKSTTTTTFSVDGRPIGGKTVQVHVTVTGNHLVFVPPTAVYGGNVQITLNGQIILSVQAAQANSTGIGSGKCIPDPTFSYCVTYKFTGTRTDIVYNLALPKGQTSYTIGARYTGDDDSHGSDAAPVTLRAINPGALSAVLETLLD
ncbi:hypothetical protein KCV01_g2450, partial [Aureobasidium melanogenum]